MSKHPRDSTEQRYAGLRSGLAPSSSPMYAHQQHQMAMPASYYAGVPPATAAAAAAAAAASSSAMSMPQPPAHPPAHAQQHQQHQQQQQQASPFDAYGEGHGVTSSSAAAALHIPPSHHRPSSGAWTPQDDQQLLAARMEGRNWSQIRDTYFQSKTPNACRKRHERLMERKGADDWDTIKMQRIAKEYMAMRKEIWSGLAARTGEKWNVIEAKCMSNGLKNLQSAARAASRRDRLETGASFSGYDDDSGISGIGLTPVDELDASYSSPETSPSCAASFSSSSVASSGYLPHPHHLPHPHPQQQQHHLQPPALLQHSHQHQQQQQQQQQHQGQAQGQGQHQSQHGQHGQGSYGLGAAAYYNGHGYSSSASSAGSLNHQGYGTSRGGANQDGSSPYLDVQRLSGSDMGIDAIVNRPGGRA